MSGKCCPQIVNCSDIVCLYRRSFQEQDVLVLDAGNWAPWSERSESTPHSARPTLINVPARRLRQTAGIT